MKKLMIYLDEGRHQDLKELAHHHKTTMAELVRYAIEETFEDQLDAILGRRRLDEHLRDPSGSISLDDYLKEIDLALPERAPKRSKTRSKAVAE